MSHETKQGSGSKYECCCCGECMYKKEFLKGLRKDIHDVSRVQCLNLGLIIQIVIGEMVKKSFPIGGVDV